MKRYLVLDEDIALNVGPANKSWRSDDIDWFYVEKGIWYIRKGTMWDGATFAYDGPEDENKQGFPILWLATLIHDLGVMAIYDYDGFPYSKRRIDKIFKYLMKLVKFEYYSIYYRAVRWFGGAFSMFFKVYRNLFNKERVLPNHTDYLKVESEHIQYIKIPLMYQYTTH